MATAAATRPRCTSAPIRPSAASRRRQAVVVRAAPDSRSSSSGRALKFLGGTPWRAPGALPGSPILWNPPFRWPFANDLNAAPHLEHPARLPQPWQRGADAESLAQYLFEAALYTWREAAIGFVFGTVLGLVLATVFVHSRLLERAFVPYVIASQTVPIIALAPMIVVRVRGERRLGRRSSRRT